MPNLKHLALPLLVLLATAVPAMAAEAPSFLPSQQQITQGIEAAERDEERREEELEGPRASREREETQGAFTNLTGGEAKELLLSSFPEQLEDLNTDPARFLSDAKIVHTVGEEAAVVSDGGNTSLMEAGIPVRTEDEEGEVGKVDLSLVEAGAGFEAKNPLVDVQIPASAAASVEVGEEGLGIALAGAAGAAQPLGEQNVFYPEVQPDSDLLVSPVAHGVELFDQLRSPQSPETLHFHLELPAGAELHADGSGGAEVVRGDEAVASIPSPTAVDAQGSEVPVGLQVEGSTLTLEVEHHGAEYAYPILVDPIVEDWLNAGVSWVNGYSYKSLENGAWQWTSEPYGQMYIGTSCFFKCWGSGRGLYVSAPSRTYGSEVHAHWAYLAPNLGSYVSQVWLNPLYREDHGCSSTQYPQPHDYEGLWSGSSWNYLRVNEALKGLFTVQEGESWGRSFVVGLSSAGGVTIPCWRDLAVGGAAVWLNDWEPPAQPGVTGVPTGWLKKGSSYTLNVEASDPGLGVQEVRLTSPGEKRWPWNQPWCSGLYENRCPASASGQLTFSTEAFMEGKVPVSVNTVSPSGKVSSPRSYELEVDGTAPAIKLSGQFAKATAGEGKEKLSLPTYNLTVKAEDLLGAGPAIGSGVKEVTVLIDDKAVASKGPSCLPGSCPGSFETTVEVPLTGLGEGEHTLEVKAKDFVGNESQPGISKIGFEYIPATGMKESYVLQHFQLPDGHEYSGEPEYEGPELAVNVMNGNVIYRERDLKVQAPSGSLDLERVYNSQQPSSRDGQWGHGWSLSQTPEFKATAGEGSAQNATMVKTGAVTSSVQLPQSQEQTTFDSQLHATVSQVAGGGYEVTSTTDEEASIFNSSGRIEETRLSSVSPAATVEPEPVFPAFVESLGASGSGNGQLSHPVDAATDAKGNLWIVDQGNNRIEEFSEAGEFVRTAGSLGSGAGQLKSPSAIAIDSAGNIDVTDTGNNRVVRFGEKGEFISALGWNVNKTKVEGGGTQAEKNRCTAASGNVCQAGTAGSLEGQMAEPVGIATIGGQDFFVVEKANARVEKFSSQGELLAKFGSLGSKAGQLKEPTGIAYASQGGGSLWVADTGNNRIQGWTTEGTWLGQAGKEGTGGGEFKSPVAIEADPDGNLYVADQGNRRVQQLSRSGDYIAEVGSGGQLGSPAGVFVNSAGELWVADSEGNRLQKWLTGSFLFTGSRIGSAGSGNGQFSQPADVAVAGGSIWVADKGNSRLEKFGEKGEFLTAVGSKGGGGGKLFLPGAVAVDPGGNLWVADTSNNRIEEFSGKGEFVLVAGRDVNKTKVEAAGTEAERNLCTAASGNTCQAGTAGATGAQLNAPQGIAAASDGSIWVADTGNNKLKKFSSGGVYLTAAASEGSGTGQVKEPVAVAIGPENTVWVADAGNNRIGEWSAKGFFIRQFGTAGSGNGQFSRPAAIDVDSSGNVWVGDRNNQRLQELTGSGQYLAQYGSSAEFNFNGPMGLAGDGKGGIWVTDTGHNRVQRVTTTQFEKPVATQVPAIGYSYSSGLLTKMELKEPEAPDPSIAVTNSGGLASSVTSEAGTATYSYTSGNLTSAHDPAGETKYERDASNRITKVELPNGTWAKVAYDSLGRATEVTVKPAGGTEKTTKFSYIAEPRETRVWGGGHPEIIYSIGEAGEVLKWWYKETPPIFEGFGGSLWANRNSPTPIENKDHLFEVTAKSQNEIASVQLLVNGTSVVAEESCEDKSEPPAHNCDAVRLEWVTNAAAHPAGQLNLEVVATDFLGHQIAERFFVTIPQQPPVDPEAPEPPTFESIKQFREDYGLDRGKSMSKVEQTRLILELLYEWEAQVPTALAAVASWGIPMRAPELEEMEWRRQYTDNAAEVIPQWAEEHASSTYGGFYVDDQAGGIIYVGFTQNQHELVEALKQDPQLLNPGQIREYPTPPVNPVKTLEATAPAVSKAIAGNPSIANLTVSVGVPPEGNIVQVGATDPVPVREFVESHFGAGAPIVVKLEEQSYFDGSGRFATSGPVMGGSALIGANEESCTAGFSARTPSGQLRGETQYKYFILTAGHCYLSGEAVGRQIKIFHSKGILIGYVKRSGYNEIVATDGEGILLMDENLRSHSVLNGDPLVPQSIFGVERPEVNKHVCWSAVYGKKHCGIVLSHIERFFGGRYKAVYVVKGPTVSGDSGGPVWDPETHKAIGLITGPSKAAGGGCHPTSFPEAVHQGRACSRMLFTPLLPGGGSEGIVPKLGVAIVKEE